MQCHSAECCDGYLTVSWLISGYVAHRKYVSCGVFACVSEQVSECVLRICDLEWGQKSRGQGACWNVVAKIVTTLILQVRELKKPSRKARTDWTYCPTSTTYGWNRYVCRVHTSLWTENMHWCFFLVSCKVFKIFRLLLLGWDALVEP